MIFEDIFCLLTTLVWNVIGDAGEKLHPLSTRYAVCQFNISDSDKKCSYSEDIQRIYFFPSFSLRSDGSDTWPFHSVFHWSRRATNFCQWFLMARFFLSVCLE